MPSLSFTAPTTVDEAIKALAGASGMAKPLSGGTDLLVQMRSGRMRPELIVDLKRIPDLIGIRENGDSFVIGAATPGVMLSEHEAFSRAWPGIVEGVDLIGSQQIQGRASLVGNLCNASPAADSVPAMICAHAVAVIAGPDGRREAPVEAIVTGPGQTSLKKGEFIVEFRVPKPKPRQSDAYLRFIPRTEMDIAVVGCGVNVILGRERRLHRCARRARRGRPDPAHRRRGRRGAEGPPARRRHAFPARRCRAASLQADQRQARHDRIPNQGRRRPRDDGRPPLHLSAPPGRVAGVH